MPVVKTQKRSKESAPLEYNYVLTCGNMIQIFKPTEVPEMRIEVQRLEEWGNPIQSIEIGLLKAEDPFG